MDFIFGREASTARLEGRPLVALESALITHGLPKPVNLETARLLESIVRSEGAAPATIGLISGAIHIGLDPEELEALAFDAGARKCSIRDLPIAITRRESGGTTVAATIRLAHMAGVRVCATGGIGGVHRGHPFDISADLDELARTPIAVVCAGAKAILDLPLTLEALETRGVSIIGYGCDEFPAFYSRSSGLPVDARADSIDEIANMIAARDTLSLQSAVLVCVPVPSDAEVPSDEIHAALEQAVVEADRFGIRGKALTPFLLERVSQLTGDRSRRANLALLENNARVAARLARALPPIPKSRGR